MANLNLSPSPSAYSDASIEGILTQCDPYIFALAQKTMPRHLVRSAGELDLEIDELAQRSRIRLWGALKRRTVVSLKAYIKRVVHSEVVDFLRYQKPCLPLAMDDDGELMQGTVLFMRSEGTGNPEEVVWREETVYEDLVRLVDVVLQLSDRQKLVFLCTLKERIDDVDRLADVLGRYSIRIEDIRWPETKKERQVLQASYAPARRAVARHLNVDMLAYK